MFTAEELKTLHEQLDALRDYIEEESPDAHESTAKGFLHEADWYTLQAAAKAVFRLYCWRNWPASTSASESSYLPTLIEAVPDSVQA